MSKKIKKHTNRKETITILEDWSKRNYRKGDLRKPRGRRVERVYEMT